RRADEERGKEDGREEGDLHETHLVRGADHQHAEICCGVGWRRRCATALLALPRNLECAPRPAGTDNGAVTARGLRRQPIGRGVRPGPSISMRVVVEFG